MGSACNKCNHLLSPINTKYMGGQSIICMLHRPRLGQLQVPKIPGTDHRWDLCLCPVQTIHTTQSCLYWNTKVRIHEDSYRPHQGSKSITVPRENYAGRHTQSLETLTKKSKMHQIQFLNGHWPKPKPPQTQRNREQSVPPHATINISHKPTHQESYWPHSKTR